MHKALWLAAVAVACSTTESTSVGAVVGTSESTSAGGTRVAPSAPTQVQLDPQERAVMEQTSPRTLQRMDRGEPLTVNDVIKLSQGGVRDATIIAYLRASHSTYELTSAQIRRLRDAGVSETVVDEMINSAQLVP